MSFISDIAGTFSNLFQLGKSGPKLKNSSGIVEHRNATDSAYAITRGADPAGADDLVTKRYGDANYGGTPSGGGSVNTVATGATLTVATTKQQIFHRKLRIVSGGKIVVQGNAQLAGIR